MARAQIVEKYSGKLVAGLAAALLTLAPHAASAGKFKVLYSQCVEQPNCGDGSGGSTGPLVMDTSLNLYGTAPHGGANLHGVAFELKRGARGNYKYKVIWNFQTAFEVPSGGMIIDTQGNLYGWAGQFYKMTYGHGRHHNKWAAEFPTLNCSTPPCSGTSPTGTLTYAGAASGAPWDGVSPLYGVAGSGGPNNGGAVYQLTPGENAWSYAELYHFCTQANCGDGKGPTGGVLLDQSGVLYGTTVQGGCSSSCDVNGGAGVAFELSPSGNTWTETVLHTFCSVSGCADGIFPTGKFAQDPAGNLIGITEQGGTPRKHARGGVLYKLIPNGAQSQQTVLYNFCQLKDCKDGSYPFGGPLLDAAGNIFGTTTDGGGNDIDHLGNGGGVVYQLTGSALRILHRFCAQPNCTDGDSPYVGLVQSASGTLYGTTQIGGAFDEGVVYELTP